MGELLAQNVARDRNCLFWIFSVLLEDNCRTKDEGSQYNKFILYLWAKSFSHQLQLLAKLRVKEVYMLCVFLTTTIAHWNFSRASASF
jgi:hypothetical protein